MDASADAASVPHIASASAVFDLPSAQLPLQSEQPQMWTESDDDEAASAALQSPQFFDDRIDLPTSPPPALSRGTSLAATETPMHVADTNGAVDDMPIDAGELIGAANFLIDAWLRGNQDEFRAVCTDDLRIEAPALGLHVSGTDAVWATLVAPDSTYAIASLSEHVVTLNANNTQHIVRCNARVVNRPSGAALSQLAAIQFVFDADGLLVLLQQDDAPAGAAALAPAATPPHDSPWKSTVCQSTGKTYYFNASTGQTSWTVPADLAAGASPLSPSATTGVASSPASPLKQAEAAVPPPWRRIVDASGGVYYHNLETNATSWSFPAGDANPSASTDAMTPLPSGWRRLSDATGSVYYHNSVTNATSWTLPKESVAADIVVEAGVDAVGVANGASAPADEQHGVVKGGAASASSVEASESREIAPESVVASVHNGDPTVSLVASSGAHTDASDARDTESGAAVADDTDLPCGARAIDPEVEAAAAAAAASAAALASQRLTNEQSAQQAAADRVVRDAVSKAVSDAVEASQRLANEQATRHDAEDAASRDAAAMAAADAVASSQRIAEQQFAIEAAAERLKQDALDKATADAALASMRIVEQQAERVAAEERSCAHAAAQAASDAALASQRVAQVQLAAEAAEELVAADMRIKAAADAALAAQRTADEQVAIQVADDFAVASARAEAESAAFAASQLHADKLAVEERAFDQVRRVAEEAAAADALAAAEARATKQAAIEAAEQCVIASTPDVEAVVGVQATEFSGGDSSSAPTADVLHSSVEAAAATVVVADDVCVNIVSSEHNATILTEVVETVSHADTSYPATPELPPIELEVTTLAVAEEPFSAVVHDSDFNDAVGLDLSAVSTAVTAASLDVAGESSIASPTVAIQSALTSIVGDEVILSVSVPTEASSHSTSVTPKLALPAFVGEDVAVSANTPLVELAAGTTSVDAAAASIMVPETIDADSDTTLVAGATPDTLVAADPEYSESAESAILPIVAVGTASAVASGSVVALADGANAPVESDSPIFNRMAEPEQLEAEADALVSARQITERGAGNEPHAAHASVESEAFVSGAGTDTDAPVGDARIDEHVVSADAHASSSALDDQAAGVLSALDDNAAAAVESDLINKIASPEIESAADVALSNSAASGNAIQQSAVNLNSRADDAVADPAPALPAQPEHDTQASSSALAASISRSLSAPTKALPMAADEFVSAWKKAVDAKNGKTYYFNASTGQTSWTQPADFIDTPALSVAALPVPPPWRRVVDPAGGVYYHNMETNATSWTLPVQEVARSLLTQPAELPAPWRRIADTTGIYYFNSETKETTWTLPVKPDGSAGADVAAAKCVEVVDGAAGVTEKSEVAVLNADAAATVDSSASTSVLTAMVSVSIIAVASSTPEVEADPVVSRASASATPIVVVTERRGSVKLPSTAVKLPLAPLQGAPADSLVSDASISEMPRTVPATRHHAHPSLAEVESAAIVQERLSAFPDAVVARALAPALPAIDETSGDNTSSSIAKQVGLNTASDDSFASAAASAMTPHARTVAALPVDSTTSSKIDADTRLAEAYARLRAAEEAAAAASVAHRDALQAARAERDACIAAARDEAAAAAQHVKEATVIAWANEQERMEQRRFEAETAFQSERADFQSRIASLNAEASVMRMQNNTLSQVLSTKDARIEQLEASVAALTRECDILRLQSADRQFEAKQSVARLQTRIEEMLSDPRFHSQMLALTPCTRCGGEFRELENSDSACTYHSGKKVANEVGYRFWSCCLQEHSRSKPAPPCARARHVCAKASGTAAATIVAAATSAAAMATTTATQ